MKRFLFACLLILSGLFTQANPPADPRAVYLDDNKRYLALMLVNESEEADETGAIQLAKDLGFNAVYLTVRWDAIKCHNGGCMTTSDPSGNTIDPNYPRSTAYWDQVDQARRGLQAPRPVHQQSAERKRTCHALSASLSLFQRNGSARQMILQGEYSDTGRGKMLEHHVSAILINALEIVSRQEGVKLPLTKADKSALHDIRALIEKHVPEYLSNEALLASVYPRLNAFKLNYGFKRLFGRNPYEYYQRLRFARAKALLEKGERVDHVAYALEYESATTFIKEFKRRFGVTPKQWGKG